MKVTNKEKIATVILIFSLTAGLTACGKTEQVSTDVRYYRANYLNDLPDTFENISLTPILKEDMVYYAANNDTYTKYGIYSYNLTTKESKTYFEQEEGKEYDPLAGGMNVDQYAIGDDGSVYLHVNSWEVDTSEAQDWSNATLEDVLNFMVDSWGYSDIEQARKDWEEYTAESYTNEEGIVDYAKVMTEFTAWDLDRTYSYSIRKLDEQGNEVYDNVITVVESDSTNGKNVVDMEVGKDGTLYLYINEWFSEEKEEKNYVIAYDDLGTEIGKCEFTSYGDRLVKLADDSIGVMLWNDNYTGYIISILDLQTIKVEKEIELSSSYVENIQPLDEENFLISIDGKLHKYNIKTQKMEDYLNWLDCDISSNNVKAYEQLEDGRLLVLTETYDYSSYESKTELAYVEEISAEEAAKIKTITLACLNVDSELENLVISVNKRNPETRIRVKDYWDSDTEMDYEDAVASFMTAMASDPEVDFIYFNGSNPYADMMNFAQKGLLIDLNPFLESDEEIKREDFIESTLATCEYDGKLVAMPVGFSIRTVIGKASDVGTESGWTFTDMKALLESKESGTQLFYGKDRAWAMSMCMDLGYKDFIDMEQVTCNFDSPEFVEVLEFANLFPEEFEWKEDIDETQLMNTGKVLLADYSVSDFAEIQMYTEIFGDKLTYIGYPTTEGNGALLTINHCFGITKNCEDTQAAWNLIRNYFLPSDGEDYRGMHYGYGMSIRKDKFDQFCEEAMSEENIGSSSWSWGSFEVQIQPATQEQVNEVKNLIANTTAVSGSVSTEMMNIINEEAAAYFLGQKSAEDVAKIIQSRMQVYLSETN